MNNNDLERTYKALQTQIQYRFTPDLQLGGNYTLSQSNGNFNGETASDGPVTGDLLSYPEYRQASWNYPIGDLSIDQRHKLRLWLNYGLRFGSARPRRPRPAAERHVRHAGEPRRGHHHALEPTWPIPAT